MNNTVIRFLVVVGPWIGFVSAVLAVFVAGIQLQWLTAFWAGLTAALLLNHEMTFRIIGLQKLVLHQQEALLMKQEYVIQKQRSYIDELIAYARRNDGAKT